jgi:hypothetical protein
MMADAQAAQPSLALPVPTPGSPTRPHYPGIFLLAVIARIRRHVFFQTRTSLD